MKLSHKLVISALIAHLILIGIFSIIFPFYFSRCLKTHYFGHLREKSKVIFLAIYEGLKKGWTGKDIEELLKSYKKEGIKVTIYNLKFLQKHPDLAKKLSLRKELMLTNKPYIFRYFYALSAQSRCLKCHSGINRGDLLGALEVDVSYFKEVVFVRKVVLFFLAIVALFLLIETYVIGYLQSKKITDSLLKLKEDIENSRTFTELILAERALDTIKTGITEIDALYEEWKRIFEKLKDLAVDKEILQLEIKLLEKIILTSEFIRDWKFYIKNLIKQIYEIVEISVVFTLFFIEKEVYDVEVFWIKKPSDEFKKYVEDTIRYEARKKFELSVLNFNHHIIYDRESFKKKEEEGLYFKTKSIILETPRIGGITGVGYSYDELLTTKEVALEAILTSLLNVIGSVKAINKHMKEVEYYATRDPLTGLYNHRVFWELIQYEIERAKRYNYKFSLMVIDIDNFKLINDTYGHTFGDKFLQEVARILKDSVRKGDIIARYGGDEFVIILPMANQEQAYSIALRIRDNFNNFYLAASDGRRVRVTVSIGIAVFPDHAKTAKELFMIADTLLFKAKKEGKNRIVVSSPEDIIAVQKEIAEMNFLVQSALAENRIIPYFQPIFDVKTNEVFAYEVLMRIETDEDTIPAAKFIAHAETLGLIYKMDQILMEKALSYAKEKSYKGYLFFNLSPKVIIVQEFVTNLLELVKKYDFPPSRIIFEITERETVRNIKLLEDFIRRLQAYGFKFCIDDFGAGFASYQYIKHFFVDFVKIEGEFILGLEKDSRIDRAVVESVVAFCKSLGIKMVAEFVETQKILDIIKELGIEYAQGYYLGKPKSEILNN
ncbi:MAG: bifunctional diguanylate cyclase/phosphodiesterase [Thermodesulfobacteria bacterium]|nr:bifunctional diguanylate cyclase/phosphodiesterase [Thermodesulfobacteriota bacterium]